MTSSDSKKVYTDGSCLKNPGGASGWSFCVLERDKTWLISGGEASSTNNRMELTAVIEALEWVTGGKYTIYTDSLLTLNCAQGIWRRKANLDLWQRYDQASLGKSLQWCWVKAHNGDTYNGLVDRAAKNEAELYKK